MTPALPQIGLGTYGRTGDVGEAAILAALEIGYRHLDTAQTYDTEHQVGAALRRSGLLRDAVFVTTKVADTNLSPAAFLPSVRQSLDALAMDRVDLLLIHWPVAEDVVPFDSYMLGLREAQTRGYTRLIGVSNYPLALLKRAEALLGQGSLATNQVELHPWLQAPRLVGGARAMAQHLTAYQPLVKGRVATDPVLRRISEAQGVAPAAVALAFLLAEGHAVIPASSSPGNLRANLAAASLTLDAADLADLRALDRGYRHINPAKSPSWDD